MPKKIRFAAVGECMIELRPATGENNFTQRFAGDTLNMSVYLQRCSNLHQLQVSYLSALGNDDPYSEQMLQFFRQENLDVSHIVQIPGLLPGLYLIHNDSSGERFFYFYRSQSAARQLFNAGNAPSLFALSNQFDYIYFSSITLSIYSSDDRARFLQFLQQAKQNGAKIIFDTNYRPGLWPNAQTAQIEIKRFLPLVDIALPTFDDEHLLFGDATPAETIKRLQQYGIQEIVVKCGEKPCWIALADTLSQIPPLAVPAKNIIDTTGAGDSFNGAYLAARLQNLAPEIAAERAHKLAAKVITFPGAIILTH